MEPRFYEVLGLILCSSNSKYIEKNLVPIEPRYNEGPRDWQNMFAITRFRHIEVLFHIFTITRVKKIDSYIEDFCYVEVRYIEVPLY